MSGNHRLCDMEVDKLLAELSKVSQEVARLTAEGKGWEECAAQMSRNADYYRGLLDEMAPVFGIASYTSDDGSVQDSPLRAKMPELVRAMAAELAEARRRLGLAEALIVEGDQMYRAIVYTSGVSLNYAADCWKKARASLPAKPSGSIPIIENPAMPQDRVDFVNDKGEVVGSIENVAKPEGQGEGENG